MDAARGLTARLHQRRHLLKSPRASVKQHEIKAAKPPATPSPRMLLRTQQGRMAAESSLQPRRAARRTQLRKGGIERHDFDAELVPHAQRTPMHGHSPDNVTNLGLRGPRWRQQPLRTKLLRQQPNRVGMDEERRERERKGGREGVGVGKGAAGREAEREEGKEKLTDREGAGGGDRER